jgi:uncharacterized protein (TIGR03437 family)
MSFPKSHMHVGALVKSILAGILAIALPAPAQVNGVVKVLSAPGVVVLGQPVTFTAGVNYTAAVPATGMITLTDTVTCANAASATVMVLGTVTLGSATSPSPGAGTLVVADFPCTGQNSIVASYPGDSVYSAGSSTALIETVLAQFTATTTSLSSSPNPSAAGQSVTFSSQLQYTLTNNTRPTGAVTFIDTNTGTVLGTGNVVTSGGGPAIHTGASFTTSALAAGSYAVQAAYSGNSMYSPSTSAIVNQVVGPGVSPTPAITSVVTTAGSMASLNTAIAQNTWIEVHGTNLAQSTQDWSKLDFSKGLPTSLAGVSATVDNKPAPIYYVSPTQVNILAPLDSALGPVPVQLSTPYGNTASVSATMQQVSPSFLVIDGLGHVAALHSDYSLVGPVSLSTSSTPVTPAKPGEIVLLYGVGFGQTSPAITDQSKGLGLALPALPTVTIGGVPATVQAAVFAPAGLYQLNVVVPATVSDGDLIVSAMYNGVSTQAGVALTVQH